MPRLKKKKKKKMTKKGSIVSMMSIICISVVELYALSLGINGVALSLAVAAIAGLGGYEIHNLGDMFKGKNPPLPPHRLLEYSP